MFPTPEQTIDLKAAYKSMQKALEPQSAW